MRRPVAVKLLPARQRRNPALLTRLQRECWSVAQIRHEGITAAYDMGEDGDLAFLVMELLEGEDLQRVITDYPSGMHVGRALGFAEQIADALAAAHARQIVHRDIKPGNLIVLPGDRIVEWDVHELRNVARALNGDIDLVAGRMLRPSEEPAAIVKRVQGRAVAGVALRLTMHDDTQVKFVRQVSGPIFDLSKTMKEISPGVTQCPVTPWGSERRDYHVALRLAPDQLGSERLAATVQLVRVDDDAILAEGGIRAAWGEHTQSTA